VGLLLSDGKYMLNVKLSHDDSVDATALEALFDWRIATFAAGWHMSGRSPEGVTHQNPIPDVC
jgi:hypothetical protein